MQSNQFKSDSINSNLNLNPAFLDSNTFITGKELIKFNLLDSTVIDSLNANYIAPDSLIVFGYKQEWSQFRKEYVPEFNYKRDLIQPLPYDSLHTVLKGVEVAFQGKKFSSSNPDWMVGVLVVSFILFATVRMIFNKYLSKLIQSITNYSTFVRLFQERFFNLLHASFRLDLIFIMTMSLFSYQLISARELNFGISNSFYVYLICMGIVIGYFTAKKIIYFILGVLTESRNEVLEYLFSITSFNRVLGLFLLPVATTIAFVDVAPIEPMLMVGIIIIAVFYLMSLIRGGKIFLKKHFSISYLILYLCTLEILPLLLIYYLLLQ